MSSRFQGYLVPEVLSSLAAKLGSHYLSNALSAFLGVGSLFFLKKILEKKFNQLFLLKVLIVIGLNPYYVIASSSTIDYIYSIFFIVVGFFFLEEERFSLAGLFVAFAISSRFSNGPLIGIIYCYYLYRSWSTKNFFKYFLSGCVGVVFTVVLYLPLLS